jgi:hypothetical protein
MLPNDFETRSNFIEMLLKVVSPGVNITWLEYNMLKMIRYSLGIGRKDVFKFYSSVI